MYQYIILWYKIDPEFVGPCHHGMAHPHVVNGGTASDMAGSCE